MSDIVPVDAIPPGTLAGLRLIETRASGVIVSVVDFDVPLSDAVTVVVTELVTDSVEIGKVAVVAPPATMTGPLTIALELLEVTVIEAPPEGAGLTSVTVPVAEFPPITELGDTLRLDNRAV